ncbi:MAG: hypothetical protein JWM78_54 [Verrucomicrobiaceae bacterium]|nr:hypothetical protein [Verrucomicrobiaceae bacterium]
MNYSRIYEFKLADSNGELAIVSALPDTNNDDAHQVLFDSLRSAFHTHPRRQFGIFDPASQGAILGAGATDYLSQKLDVDELGLQFARQILQGMKSSEKPHPWHLWFIIEPGAEGPVLYLFLLKHEEIHYISAQQTVTLGSAIQPSRLQFAVKLSFTEWQSAQSKTYLSYLAPKNQDPVTVAWNELIGFAEGTDRSAKTEEFLTVMERYAEALPPEKEQDCRARVIDYCLDQDRVGEPVEIKALSRHVDEEVPEALLNFYTEHFEEPSSPLYADRKQLKRYTRFYGRDNDLSIGFSTSMLGGHITYDASTETLIIRAIPKSLKSQLARHVKKSE